LAQTTVTRFAIYVIRRHIDSVIGRRHTIVANARVCQPVQRFAKT